MKFTILDVYPSKNHRLVKDTAGGYGTGNNFGDTAFSKLLNLYVDKSIGMPSIESMYVSSILKKEHDVAYTRDINDKAISDSDYIILPSSIVSHETEIEAIRSLSNKKIFVIGIFSNTLREKYTSNNTVVIKNESDIFFYNLFKENKLNKEFLEKIFLDHKLINSFYAPVNLDDLPFPDWADYSKNFPLINNFFALKQKIAIPILATRGCPYSCFNYCTYPLQQGRKVRSRSIDNIIDEIIYWKKKLNTNKFIFRDPVFSINKKHTVEFCKKIIEKKIKIRFMVETHLNNLDDEMIELLSKSGLELVYVGIESADNFVLSDMKRFTIKNDRQYEIIDKCEKAGIKVKTMFIIGNPEDNEDTIKKTIKYSTYLPSLYSQFSVFTPYPGTPVFDKFKSIITEKKYEKFDQYTLTFSHKYLDEAKIEELKSLAYFKFYFDFKRIFRIIIYFFKSKYM